MKLNNQMAEPNAMDEALNDDDSRWSLSRRSPIGNTSVSNSATFAKGISDAHLLSRYSISTLVRPWSYAAVGLNVRGPSVWQAHRFHRGFGTFTSPKRILTGVLPEPFVVCRRPQWRYALRFCYS